MPTITRISVRAERCFNHPFESYSNLRPALEMTADLVPGEDPLAATRELQAKAETMIEQHKTLMLEQIKTLHRSASLTQELKQMESTLSSAQKRYAEAKKELEDLPKSSFFRLSNGEEDGDKDPLKDLFEVPAPSSTSTYEAGEE